MFRRITSGLLLTLLTLAGFSWGQSYTVCPQGWAVPGETPRFLRRSLSGPFTAYRSFRASKGGRQPDRAPQDDLSQSADAPRTVALVRAADERSRLLLDRSRLQPHFDSLGIRVVFEQEKFKEFILESSRESSFNSMLGHMRWNERDLRVSAVVTLPSSPLGFGCSRAIWASRGHRCGSLRDGKERKG